MNEHVYGFIDLSDLRLYAPFEMKRKFIGLIFTLLFILSGAVAAYSQCGLVDDHVASGAEQESPFIHCPDVVSNSSVQASPLFRFHASDLAKALATPAFETNGNLAIGHFREITCVKPFFQRNLYQLEEVYRL